MSCKLKQIEKIMYRIVSICAIVSTVGITHGRVYYIDNSEGDFAYPADRYEQSSRDLDLTFSAGNPNENDLRNTVQSVKKDYGIPEKSLIEINKEIDPSPSYYRIIEVPERRTRLKEIFVNPENNRKPIKGNGEIILELRIIANNDRT